MLFNVSGYCFIIQYGCSLGCYGNTNEVSIDLLTGLLKLFIDILYCVYVSLLCVCVSTVCMCLYCVYVSLLCVCISIVCMCLLCVCVFIVSMQDLSKVFTTGQARFNPEHYVIK